MRGARIATPWLNRSLAASDKRDWAQYGHEPVTENTEVADAIKAEMQHRLDERPGKIEPRAESAAKTRPLLVLIAEQPADLAEGASQQLATEDSRMALSEESHSALTQQPSRRFCKHGAVTISLRSDALPDLDQAMVGSPGALRMDSRQAGAESGALNRVCGAQVPVGEGGVEGDGGGRCRLRRAHRGTCAAAAVQRVLCCERKRCRAC